MVEAQRPRAPLVVGGAGDDRRDVRPGCAGARQVPAGLDVRGRGGARVRRGHGKRAPDRGRAREVGGGDGGGTRGRRGPHARRVHRRRRDRGSLPERRASFHGRRGRRGTGRRGGRERRRFDRSVLGSARDHPGVRREGAPEADEPSTRAGRQVRRGRPERRGEDHAADASRRGGHTRLAKRPALRLRATRGARGGGDLRPRVRRGARRRDGRRQKRRGFVLGGCRVHV
mmetsp:Transcript_7032/g.28979  ORF Transcript_7032/g.28979 Transcript_7032/m.28979 type:complete len:229 (-) Transcript_7032:1936-2622(-)